jgi:type VI secretion system protein VasD
MHVPRASTLDVRHGASLVLLAIVVGASACGKPPAPQLAPEPPPPPPAAAQMVVSAAADANPDARGRPSPIVVRVYQLKSDATFGSVEFFGLFDDEEQALGADLISRAELVLAPAEQRTIELAVDGEAKFVAAAAAFRDIRNAGWRTLVPAWREGTRLVMVQVARDRITAAVSDAEQAW